MDGLIAYSLAKKIAESSASGITNIYKKGDNLVFEMSDGTKFEMNISDLFVDDSGNISEFVLDNDILKIHFNDKTIKSVDLSKYLDGRDFSKNPINLQTEVTGVVKESNLPNTIAKKSDLHQHKNKNIIDLIQEDSNGVLTYRGIAVGGVAGIANIHINGNDLTFVMNDGTSFTVSLDNVSITNGNVESIEFQNDALEVTYGDLTKDIIDLSKYLDGRDFSKNPINLQTEVTGVVKESNLPNTMAKKSDLHQHDNISVLKEIGENVGGRLTYKGTIIDGIDGLDGKNLEFVWRGTELGVRIEGETSYKYVNLKGVDGVNGTNGIDGIDGLPVELSLIDNQLQWRYVGQTGNDGWNTIIDIDELRANIESLQWGEF